MRFISQMVVVIPVSAGAFLSAYFGAAAVSYWIDQNVIDALVNFMGWLGRSVGFIDAAIDKYVVDGAVNGIASLTWNSGKQLRRLQTGHIQSYLFGALGGAIAFVIIQYVIR